MNKSDRDKVKKAVILALSRANTIELPVNIKHIAKSLSNCRLIKYSKFMKSHNMSYEEMIDYAGTIDAFTDYYAQSDKYVIYYNDLDSGIMSSNRYRWNIAHELGHIMLAHHKHTNKSRLFRNTLSNEEYKMLEAEADYFASYILAPYAALSKLGVHTKHDIARHCKISDYASQYRFMDYVKWDARNAFDYYDNSILKFFYNSIYQKKCLRCSHYFISHMAAYCPICGNNTFKRKKDTNMEYINEYNLDENGKVINECTHCENEDLPSDGVFCKICGTPVVNKCTNQSCNKTGDGNSRYCIYCGSETTFFKHKMLHSWDYRDNSSHYTHPNFDESDDLPF